MENITMVFDSFLAADTKRQKQIKAKELSYENSTLVNTCGSCNHWMTSLCPKETRSNKVSCNGNACEMLDLKQWVIDLVKDNNIKIQLLKSECL